MNRQSQLFSFIFVFLGYAVLASLGKAFSTLQDFASPIWLASGFCFFSLIRFGLRSALWVFLGSMASALLFRTDIRISLVLSLAASVEGMVSSTLFLHLLKKRAVFIYHNRLVALLVASAVSAFVSATIGLGYLRFASDFSSEQIVFGWLTWYGGNFLGSILFFPMLVFLSKRIRRRIRFKGSELLVTLGMCLGFSALIIVSKFATLLLIVFPFFMMVIMKRGMFTTMLNLNLISLICVASLNLGVGPFVLGPNTVNLFACMVYLMTLTITVYALISFHRTEAIKPNRIFLFLIWIIALGTGILSETIFLNRDHARFESLAYSAKADLEDRIKDYERVLYGASAFFRASDSVSRHDWKIFAMDYDIVNIIPGFWGIGFIDVLTAQQIKNVERLYQADGIPRFNVKILPDADLNVGELEKHYIVKYIEPEERISSAIGLNVGSESKRRQALEFARDNGVPVIVDGIQLYQDAMKRRGFLIFVPVFDRTFTNQGMDERRAKLKGWTFTAVVLEDFIKNAIKNQFPEIVFSIHSTVNTKRFYEPPGFTSKSKGVRHFELELPLHFAQQHFDFLVRPSDRFHYARAQEVSITSSFIILLGLLLTVVVVNLQLTNRRVSQQVQLRTQELLRAQEIAESHRAISVESSRLASLGEMAGGIAHEINNPLSIILVKVFNLKSRFKKGPVETQEILQSLDKIEVTSYRIAKIIRGMRTLSTDGSRYDFERIKLSQIVEDVLDICRETFKGKGIELKVDLSQDCEVYGRSIQLSQVLVNLLNNAEHEVELLPQPWIQIRTFVDVNSKGIEVVDCGSGVSPEIASRIMEPFFTTKEIGKGTGLGLSIGRSIMKDHGGRLEYNAQAQHTTFIMRFPKDEYSEIQS